MKTNEQTLHFALTYQSADAVHASVTIISRSNNDASQALLNADARSCD
jgi:hypothetical protein